MSNSDGSRSALILTSTESKFQLLLNQAAKELCGFLQTYLPQDTEDWWDTRVIPALTDNQRRFASAKTSRRLTDLDFAGLLRVLDYNWKDLAPHVSEPSDALEVIGDMQLLRNRWSHRDQETMRPRLLRRHFDTVLLFLQTFSNNSELIQRVRQDVAELSTHIDTFPTKPPQDPKPPLPPEPTVPPIVAKLRVGGSYTWSQLCEILGVQSHTIFPQRNGIVIAGLFRRDMNPRAPGRRRSFF